MKQSEIIQKLTDKQLKQQLLLSQALFFMISILLSLFFFEHITDWFSHFSWQWKEIALYGVGAAVLVVLIEILLYTVLPAHFFDDGGINERIFKNQPIHWIATISFVVAIAEEMLFRGVLQVTFGYFIASSLFAIIHIRYLKKPVLLLLVTLLSFLIGFIFLRTENLLVTIVFHFSVDFLLGLVLKYKK